MRYTSELCWKTQELIGGDRSISGSVPSCRFFMSIEICAVAGTLLILRSASLGGHRGTRG
jgi:hypothetical protein